MKKIQLCSSVFKHNPVGYCLMPQVNFRMEVPKYNLHLTSAMWLQPVQTRRRRASCFEPARGWMVSQRGSVRPHFNTATEQKHTVGKEISGWDCQIFQGSKSCVSSRKGKQEQELPAACIISRGQRSCPKKNPPHKLLIFKHVVSYVYTNAETQCADGFLSIHTCAHTAEQMTLAAD